MKDMRIDSGAKNVILMFSLVFALQGMLEAQSDYLQESEKKARDILAKVIDALGGKAFIKMTDIHRMGRFYQFRKDQLKGGGRFQLYEKFPGKTRFELGKKSEIVNINDGDKGWKIEYKNVKAQTPEEIANYKINLKHNLDHILRYRLDEPGMRFRYLGRSRVDINEIESIQLIDKDNDKIVIHVDAATFLPTKMEFRSPAVGIFEPTDDERLYYNYHVVQGVKVPYSTVRFANGFKASEFQVEEVQIDLSLPDAFFTPEYTKK